MCLFVWSVSKSFFFVFIANLLCVVFTSLFSVVCFVVDRHCYYRVLCCFFCAYYKNHWGEALLHIVLCLTLYNFWPCPSTSIYFLLFVEVGTRGRSWTAFLSLLLSLEGNFYLLFNLEGKICSNLIHDSFSCE